MMYRKMKTIPANYFSKHMLAMTEENLDSKADIAQELAVRDYYIDSLINASSEVLRILEKIHDLQDHRVITGSDEVENLITLMATIQKK